MKAALGWHAINDSVAGPVHAGHRVRAAARPRERGGRGRRPPVGLRARRDGPAHRRSWPTPRARRAATIRLRRRGRARARRRGGRAVGVQLADGEELRGAPRALERRPQAHVPDAVRPRRPARRRSSRGSRRTAAWARASRSTSRSTSCRTSTGCREGGVQPYHRGIMELNPFIAEMDAQQAQAVQGIPADPAHIELCFPTVHDPSLAPEGKHIVTIDVNSQPYRLREGSWDDDQGGPRRPRDRDDRRVLPEASRPDRAPPGASRRSTWSG